VGPPLAEYGQRVVGFLIDYAILIAADIAVIIVGRIVGVVIGFLGALIFFFGWIAVLAYAIWNLCYRQGLTGQTIGKSQQGVSLVTEATGQPVGFGGAFLRYLIFSILSSITCGVYFVLDLLWPLWDPKRQRITDKILKYSVIKSQAVPFDMNVLNPFNK
jgi:uncharacterized RDD family membrane protein YckC